MPQFIMEGILNPEFQSLPEFVQGYIEALFFTETAPGIDIAEFETPEYQKEMGEGRTDGCLPSEAGFQDLSADALSQILADCAKFQKEAAALLESAYRLQPGSDGFRYARNPINPKRAGNLFWYARNGHGVTWMDDGDSECLRGLQDLCRPFGEVNPYWHAGKVELG